MFDLWGWNAGNETLIITLFAFIGFKTISGSIYVKKIQRILIFDELDHLQNVQLGKMVKNGRFGGWPSHIQIDF